MIYCDYIEFDNFNKFINYLTINKIEHFEADTVLIHNDNKYHQDQNTQRNNRCRSISIQTLSLSNVHNVEHVFKPLTQLKTLHIQNLEPNNLKSLSYMFDSSSIKNLTINWICDEIETVEGLFNNCVQLKNINGKIEFSTNLMNANSMFNNCPSITPGSISWLKTYNATTDYIFKGCSNSQALLTILNTNNMNISHSSRRSAANDISGMLYGIFSQSTDEIINIFNNSMKQIKKTTKSSISQLVQDVNNIIIDQLD